MEKDSNNAPLNAQCIMKKAKEYMEGQKKSDKIRTKLKGYDCAYAFLTRQKKKQRRLFIDALWEELASIESEEMKKVAATTLNFSAYSKDDDGGDEEDGDGDGQEGAERAERIIDYKTALTEFRRDQSKYLSPEHVERTYLIACARFKNLRKEGLKTEAKKKLAVVNKIRAYELVDLEEGGEVVEWKVVKDTHLLHREMPTNDAIAFGMKYKDEIAEYYMRDVTGSDEFDIFRDEEIVDAQLAKFRSTTNDAEHEIVEAKDNEGEDDTEDEDEWAVDNDGGD